jgi:polysaccharide pyruvyl transferase WcaK-like protein
MKGDTPRITLLGNNAGRNVGDMAIMSSILQSLTSRLPGARFYIPSTSPEWTRRHYGRRFDVHALNVMPWTGSLRLLGLPTFYALASSDVALICDGIIFGNRLFNPAFNYLITLVLLVPLARLLNCKVVCYSCGLGPFPSAISRLLARWTINGCDLVMFREKESERLARDIGVHRPIEVTGDAAFINPVASDERAIAILGGLHIAPGAPLLALNVTAYMDQWLPPDERLTGQADLIPIVARAVNQARERVHGGFTPLLVATHPMDEAVCRRLAGLVDGKVLCGFSLVSHEVQAVLRRCGLLVGMRFHSLVLASSVETPVMALVYAPKVRGYMQLLECEDVSLELASLQSGTLAEAITRAWEGREQLRKRQVPVIRGLKAGAERAADVVAKRYFAGALKVPTPRCESPSHHGEAVH